jgi:amino acid transporter
MTSEEKMNTHKTAARIFGVLFLISFLAYGAGSALIQSIVGAPDILSNVYASTTLLVIAAILMGVVHTFTNIGLPVVLRPVLKPRNETLYFGYLSAAIVATVALLVGVIFLLLLLPLRGSASREMNARLQGGHGLC